MSDKVTWKEVYDDFKQHFPRLGKRSYDFNPYGYATILVKLRNGEFVVYDYDEKTATPIDEDEIRR